MSNGWVDMTIYDMIQITTSVFSPSYMIRSNYVKLENYSKARKRATVNSLSNANNNVVRI